MQSRAENEGLLRVAESNSLYEGQGIFSNKQGMLSPLQRSCYFCAPHQLSHGELSCRGPARTILSEFPTTRV